MNWVGRKAICSALVLGGFLGLAYAAEAAPQTIALSTLNTTGTTTYDIGPFALVFASQTLTNGTLRGCDYSTTTGGSCGNDQIVADVVRGTLELTFENKSGPSGALLTGSNGTNTHNLYFNFTVTYNRSASVTMSQATLGVTGTGTDLSDITATETINNPSYSFNTSAAASSPIAQTISPALNSFSVSKDLKTTGVSGLVLNVITQHYVSSPEPVSLSILGVGIAGLALVKRRNRRVV
jgi:hypothetical protein